MSENKAKKVKEIFSDYETKANIKEAYVAALNVIKKTNTLGIVLEIDEYIEIKEIWYFEKFLTERFSFANIDMTIKYQKDTQLKSIKDEWRNIICYMAHKYPLMKPMLLMKSDVEINDNVIDVKMHIRGADFLKAKKTDIELENVIKKLYGKEYKIQLEEIVKKEDEIEYEKKIKEIEEKELKMTTSYVQANEQENQHLYSAQVPEYNDPDYMPPQDGDIYMPAEEAGEIPNGMAENMAVGTEISDPEKYIMGKPSRAKEKLIKIKDITANDGRVTLEGRVINCECRETKSGKGMLIIDLYDGTGTIVCKSFAKDAKEGNDIKAKIDEVKGIKVIGKAGLDTYAGDITVIANTIIEISENIPELPTEEEEEDTPLILGKNMNITAPLAKISELGPDDGAVSLDGEIIFMEPRELKSGKTLLSFDLYDGTSTLTCKAFLEKDKAKKIIKKMESVKGIKIEGNAQMDSFSGELTVMANTIVESTGVKKEVRQDNAEVKRVELHMHTKMSQMDAVTSATDLIKRAMKWGMKSIAITDHGVAQAFPEAYHLVGDDNPDIKVIYGVEAYLAPDNTKSIYNGKGQDIDATYCVLDLETTGFSATNDRITEIGIMKVKNKEVIDEFSCFVNPERHIPERVTEVTNISDDMVKDAETIEKVFPKMLEFLGDQNETVIVAHNANFDVGFLKQNAKRLGYDFNYSYLDTLSLAKDLFPDYKKYKLGKIAENLGIKVEVAHRALDDVDTTVKVFNIMIDMLKEKGAKKLEDIDDVAADPEAKAEEYKKLKTYHAIILAKNYEIGRAHV